MVNNQQCLLRDYFCWLLMMSMIGVACVVWKSFVPGTALHDALTCGGLGGKLLCEDGGVKAFVNGGGSFG